MEARLREFAFSDEDFNSLRSLVQARLAFFREQLDGGIRRLAVTPNLRELITFNQLNLMHES
jgi:chemotaxis methyl-accepting protein methylase